MHKQYILQQKLLIQIIQILKLYIEEALVIYNKIKFFIIKLFINLNNLKFELAEIDFKQAYQIDPQNNLTR